MKDLEHYCVRCGKSLKDHVKVCKNCGFKHLQSPPTRSNNPTHESILDSILIGYLGEENIIRRN
jgi:ribosomal protein L37E